MYKGQHTHARSGTHGAIVALAKVACRRTHVLHVQELRSDELPDRLVPQPFARVARMGFVDFFLAFLGRSHCQFGALHEGLTDALADKRLS